MYKAVEHGYMEVSADHRTSRIDGRINTGFGDSYETLDREFVLVLL